MLRNITVLEIGEYITIPYAGRLLAEAGASIFKAEPPEGDVTRRLPPFIEDVPDLDASAYFAFLNAGKLSITLRRNSTIAPSLIQTIVETHDVDVIISDTLDLYGIDGESLAEYFPNLSVISVSGFGENGPFGDFLAPDIIAMAESGNMNKMGYPERPPTRPRIPSADFWTGQYVALTALATVLGVTLQSSEGQYVEISKREAAMTTAEGTFTAYSYSGEVTERTGDGYANQDGQPGIPAIFQTADGYISAAVTGAGWHSFCTDVTERAELLDDPRFETRENRLKNLDKIRNVVEDYTIERKKWDLFEEFQEAGIPAGVASTPADVLDFNHLKERSFWEKLTLPEGHSITAPGSPMKVDGERLDLDEVPSLGEHNPKVYGPLKDQHAEKMILEGI